MTPATIQGLGWGTGRKADLQSSFLSEMPFLPSLFFFALNYVPQRSRAKSIQSPGLHVHSTPTKPTYSSQRSSKDAQDRKTLQPFDSDMEVREATLPCPCTTGGGSILPAPPTVT